MQSNENLSDCYLSNDPIYSDSFEESDVSDQIIDDPNNDSSDISSEYCDIESQIHNSKDGENWSSVPNKQNSRICSENILKFVPGFKSKCLKKIKTSWDALCQFIDTEMLQTIVMSTNEYLKKEKSGSLQIKINDFIKFIGTSLLIGMMKGKNMDFREFWSHKYGQALIYNTMSLKLFESISSNLRFDIKNKRDKNDKLAPIRLIWDKFISNCKLNYVPSDQMTIDEQLVTFRGRCGFKMFIPSKPGKYGIKIWALCDAKNAYLFNAKIYTGKENGVKEVNQGENIVKLLTIPLYKSGRNITTDNFFTSLNLARFLLDQKLTLVGTVRKNKRFLPQEFQSSNGSAFKIQHLYQEKITLVKFNPKKNKSVVLLSSLHHSGEIDPQTRKPEIISYYNSTKGGVDTLDQVIRFFSTKRKTRRWPMAIFYNMIDIAAYNAYLLYCQANSEFTEKYGNRSRKENFSNY